MLSAGATLEGEGLSPDELLDQIYFSFFYSETPLDDSKVALQIRFAERIKMLSEEKELNPRLKATLTAFQNTLHKKAKKRAKSGTSKEKNHYRYLARITELN
jgi:hypothetical protein